MRSTEVGGSSDKGADVGVLLTLFAFNIAHVCRVCLIGRSVAQHYLLRPLTINGYKFDLGRYALVLLCP